jgi:hypothetical protein
MQTSNPRPLQIGSLQPPAETRSRRRRSLRCKNAAAVTLSELWLDHVWVVETSRNVMDGMYRRSVHAGKRVADFERQSLDVLRTAWGAVPLARAYPGETPAQDRAEIAAAETRSRTPMRHM